MAILGLDEVGRGPLAGPLVVGAVIFRDHKDQAWRLELRDSKKLTPLKRAALDPVIRAHSIVGLGWVMAWELDNVGVSKALVLASRRAVQSVLAQLKTLPVKATMPKITEVIIDGTVNFLAHTNWSSSVTVLKKADDLIKEVSAASIVAKVAHDNYMNEVAKQFPQFDFSHNMGYGTARHLQALKEHGACAEHRFCYRPVASYIKKVDLKTLRTEYLEKNLACQKNFLSLSSSKPLLSPPQLRQNIVKNTTKIGKTAEAKVADYLIARGWELLARNLKTKTYEIDLLMTKADTLAFIEVRYRRNQDFGGGLASVGPKKINQIRYAATRFLSELANGRTFAQNYQSSLLSEENNLFYHRLDRSLLTKTPQLLVVAVENSDFSVIKVTPVDALS